MSSYSGGRLEYSLMGPLGAAKLTSLAAVTEGGIPRNNFTMSTLQAWIEFPHRRHRPRSQRQGALQRTESLQAEVWPFMGPPKSKWIANNGFGMTWILTQRFDGRPLWNPHFMVHVPVDMLEMTTAHYQPGWVFLGTIAFLLHDSPSCATRFRKNHLIGRGKRLPDWGT